jgi:hypothetical protein
VVNGGTFHRIENGGEKPPFWIADVRVFYFRRRAMAMPASPAPSRPSVMGSGTSLVDGGDIKIVKFFVNLPPPESVNVHPSQIFVYFYFF